MKNLRITWLIAGVLVSLIMVSCNDDDDGDTNGPTTDVSYTNIALTGENEAPTPVTTDGVGVLNATYNKETNILMYDVSWTLGNEEDQTVGMHFHGPASTTESADVIIGITLPHSNSTGSVSGQTRALTQNEENDLLNGLWYLNIHSTSYPAGEIRGQLVQEGQNSNNGSNNNGNNNGTGY